MKTIFMGTPDFAVPSLQVTRDITDLRAIFTQPDKKRGRGQKISFSPVKEFANEYGIDVYQPKTLRDSEVIDCVNTISPDLIVVVAYGKILPREILKIPRYGCINVHGSLLPKYRGAAPMQWALMNGEKSTGITTMLMDEGLDTGDILLQRKISIDDQTTLGDLHDQLKQLGAECLKETIENLQLIKPRKQLDSNISYSHDITKEKRKKKKEKSIEYICNLIR